MSAVLKESPLVIDMLDTAGPDALALDPQPAWQPSVAPERALALAEHSPMSMMLAAHRQGVSLADVREMMAIHREMKADEAREMFSADFANFRGENVIIPKTKTVDRGRAGSFDQAEYDQVCRRLSPALSRHGFSFRHDQKFGLRRMMIEGVESDVGWVWVTCFLEHRKGHVKTLELDGPPGDLSANTPIQNMQSTASFFKRNSLLSITGTATGGEDDEANLHDLGGSAGTDYDDGGPPFDTDDRRDVLREKPTTYDATMFAANLPQWREVIGAGRKTPDALIEFIEKRNLPLTPDQKQQLRAARAA